MAGSVTYSTQILPAHSNLSVHSIQVFVMPASSRLAWNGSNTQTDRHRYIADATRSLSHAHSHSWKFWPFSDRKYFLRYIWRHFCMRAQFFVTLKQMQKGTPVNCQWKRNSLNNHLVHFSFSFSFNSLNSYHYLILDACIIKKCLRIIMRGHTKCFHDILILKSHLNRFYCFCIGWNCALFDFLTSSFNLIQYNGCLLMPKTLNLKST